MHDFMIVGVRIAAHIYDRFSWIMPYFQRLKSFEIAKTLYRFYCIVLVLYCMVVGNFVIRWITHNFLLMLQCNCDTIVYSFQAIGTC